MTSATTTILTHKEMMAIHEANDRLHAAAPALLAALKGVVAVADRHTRCRNMPTNVPLCAGERDKPTAA